MCKGELYFSSLKVKKQYHLMENSTSKHREMHGSKSDPDDLTLHIQKSQLRTNFQLKMSATDKIFQSYLSHPSRRL